MFFWPLVPFALVPSLNPSYVLYLDEKIAFSLFLALLRIAFGGTRAKAGLIPACFKQREYFKKKEVTILL